ncbi:MAG: hypothetical protein WAW03_18040 [Anaerolineae bacterium]
MNALKLFSLALVLTLLATLTGAAGSAPLAGPCIPGAAYDPACDANQDGTITVNDIQLTAGHWSQSGAYVSDNNHNHLGQTWTGMDNPLKIQGSYGAPDFAPLVLNNSTGVGLRIAAADSAVFIDSTGYHGLWVYSAAHDGLRVSTAGTDGVHVDSAGGTGLFVATAAVHGVDVAGNLYAGVFAGNIYVGGNCVGCLQANFAVNVGDRALQPGDVVSIQAVTPTDFDTGPALWQVVQAQPGQAIVGVVAGRAELVTEIEHRPTETGKRLVPRDGAAQRGEYVTVVYSGPMQVRIAPGESAIAAGTRLTAAAGGRVRPLQTRTVEGMVVTEGTPVIGTALESLAAGEGLIWVLVNPQ